ncbi:MAG: hypothetical protein N5P05_003788 [Chroococcopsis gigantea SAG 12.99]|jgi:glycosyltransferase involved in cell wall biosynthesis|nr:glycosyltransferase family 2 protein [Chlorogloea purpurea SAG 13.99]MDV3002182.1 hypothetical protein [Chroococcopsis gigantea SAG 12.99]
MEVFAGGFNTPIVIIAYNRPHLLQQVLSIVRQVQPTQLFLVVDGHKSHTDNEKCQEVRYLLSNIDWPCDVRRDYSEENQGCGYRIASGLDRVFQQVDKAIILEDDCLPHPTFFPFCQTLLTHYEHEDNITQICGTNRLLQWKNKEQSYLFARYGSAWGWATWRRSWQKYGGHSRLWSDPGVREKIERVIGQPQQYDYFCQRYRQAEASPRLIWDYQWSLVQLAGAGRSIIPTVNLVKNLGFNADATHTHRFCLSNLIQDFQPMTFPLRGPVSSDYDDEYDRRHFAFSIGKPEPDSLTLMIDKLISAGRFVHALLLLNKAITQYPDEPRFQKQRELVLQLRAQKQYV